MNIYVKPIKEQWKEMKLYKVISKDNKAKDGGDFDYTKYLPKGDKKGKWTPTIKNIKECYKGWHVTPYWNMYLDDKDNRIFEVEVKGIKETNSSVGVNDKYVCESIRLTKEIIFTFDKNWNIGYRNTGDKNIGDWNTGDWNTGDKNIGNRNTGDKNIGNRNTGNLNTGDRNTGDKNTGYRNTGNLNIGDRNTGNWNTGNWNTGYRNTGHMNTGNRNTGDRNTGHMNTGNRNTGDWNTCNEETGYFNTLQRDTIRIFNKECLRSDWEKVKKPIFLYFELDEKLGYKKSFHKAFNKAKKEDIDLLIKLPNFDYKVFEEISGITRKMINKRLK